MGDNEFDPNKVKIMIDGKVYEEDWVVIKTPPGYNPGERFVMDATDVPDFLC